MEKGKGNISEPSTFAQEPSVIHRARESPWPAISMSEAYKLIEQHMPAGTHKLINANVARPGHVLVQRVLARDNVPEFHTSTKDGYAVIAADRSELRRVVGAQTAEACGHPDESSAAGSSLQFGECIRVCTGSVMPPGADAVVMVEKTLLVEHDGKEEKVIRVLGDVQKGQDVRTPGSDIREGDVLLEEGTVLGSGEIGLLASNARRDIEVYRSPRVCVMSTGNELVDCSVEEALRPGQVRDSNRPQLIALLHQRGFKPIDAGIVQDNRASLVEAIRCALRFSPVLITTGGVSMGEKDLMKDILQRDFQFTIHFGRVWMKPGLPSTFATGTFEDRHCAVFALPGNPVSSWVSTELFVMPSLRRMAGYPHPYHTLVTVKLGSAVRLDARPEYVRATVAPSRTADNFSSPVDGSEQLTAYPTGAQHSSRLLSVSGANVLLRLPAKSDACTSLPAGALVHALVLGVL